MSDQLHIHLAASTNYDLRFTQGGTGHPNPAPSWVTIPAGDASANAVPTGPGAGVIRSVKPLIKYPATGRKMESIQIVLKKLAAGSPANAVVNLFAVRGGGGFQRKKPNGNGGTQRLIAKFVVRNGTLDFQKSVFKESLTPRKNKPQHNHKPGSNDSRSFRVIRTKTSAADSSPGPVPIGTQPNALKAAPGIILVHGGLHIAFSPEI